MLMNGPSPQLSPMVLQVDFPRALHAGRCGGVHFQAKTSDACDIAEDVKVFTPPVIFVIFVPKKKKRRKEPTGQANNF